VWHGRQGEFRAAATTSSIARATTHARATAHPRPPQSGITSGTRRRGSVLLQFRRKLPAARPRFIGAGRKVELLPTLSLAAA
jgi:hypothetical protein